MFGVCGESTWTRGHVENYMLSYCPSQGGLRLVRAPATFTITRRGFFKGEGENEEKASGEG